MVDRAKRGARSPARTVLVTPVHEALMERIMDQGLAPGSRLNIDGLAEQLGTSPTPVREALARLAAERVVEFTPFKGYSVMPLLDQRQLADLMHVRRLLEVDGARIAAQRMIRADIRAMERAQEAMAGDTPDSSFGEFRDYNRFDRVFHETLLAGSGNTVLVDTWRGLHVHTMLARLYHDRGQVDYRESVREHQDILDSIRDADPDATADAVRRHIDGVEQRLGAILDRHIERAQQSNDPS